MNNSGLRVGKASAVMRVSIPSKLAEDDHPGATLHLEGILFFFFCMVSWIPQADNKALNPHASNLCPQKDKKNDF